MKKIISIFLAVMMLLTAAVGLSSCANVMPEESSPEGSGNPDENNPNPTPEIASKSWHYVGSSFPGLAEMSFDSDGKPVRIEIFNIGFAYSSIDGMNYRYRTFNYVDGLLSYSVAYGYSEEAGITESPDMVEIYRMNYVYDESGKIIRGDIVANGLKTGAYDLYSYEGDVCTVKCFNDGELNAMFRYNTATNQFVGYADSDADFNIIPNYGEDGNVISISHAELKDQDPIGITYSDGKIATMTNIEEDSSVYVFTYTESGKMKSVKASTDEGDSAEYSFEYDEKGRNTKAILSETYGDRSAVMTMEFAYDENGMFTESSQTRTADGPSSKQTIKFNRNDKGLIVSTERSIYENDTLTEGPTVSESYVYNDKGQLIEHANGNIDVPEGEDIMKTVYEYYESGALKKETYNGRVTEYYENGLKKSQSYTSWNEESILDEYLDHGVDYMFNRNGYNYKTPSGSGGDRNADKTTITDKDGNVETVERTFDSAHRILTQKYTNPKEVEEGSQQAVIRVFEYGYTYDENGENIKRVEKITHNIFYPIDSNEPTSYYTDTNVEYYENGRTAKRETYDEDGRLTDESIYKVENGRNYISKHTYYKENGNYVVTEYDSNNNKLSEIEYDKDGNALVKD